MKESKTLAPSKPQPMIHGLSAVNLPEIKGWKVGNSYEVTAKLKMTSLSENEYEGKKEISASFEIVNINDRDFKDKSYKDLVDEETSEGEENE